MIVAWRLRNPVSMDASPALILLIPTYFMAFRSESPARRWGDRGRLRRGDSGSRTSCSSCRSWFNGMPVPDLRICFASHCIRGSRPPQETRSRLDGHPRLSDRPDSASCSVSARIHDYWAIIWCSRTRSRSFPPTISRFAGPNPTRLAAPASFRRNEHGYDAIRHPGWTPVLRYDSRAAHFRVLAASDDGRGQGGMVLLDDGWSETSRERQRQEALRIWGRKGAKAQGTPAEQSEGQSWVRVLVAGNRRVVLVLAGICAFVVAYDLLLSKPILEAAPMVFIGFIVFRGGIHVLKVAVAGEAAPNLPETAQPGDSTCFAGTPGPVGPTVPNEVLPGPSSGADGWQSRVSRAPELPCRRTGRLLDAVGTLLFPEPRRSSSPRRMAARHGLDIAFADVRTASGRLSSRKRSIVPPAG